MSNQEQRGDRIEAVIQGNTSGQIAVGKDIVQTVGPAATTAPAVTEAELAALRQELADLRARVEAEAPAEQRPPALERLNELEAATTAKEPDRSTISTMEYVRDWFVRNLPSLAGAVSSVVVNPIVGKLVQVAGDSLAAEWRRRFDVPQQP